MTALGARTRASALAWAIWLLGALLYSYGFFQRVAPSVMVSDLMREFAASAVVLGNLSAFYFYAYAGLQFPLGVLLDRFGPRRIMAASALVAAAGSLLFGLAETLSAAYLGRFLIGAGVAVALIGTFKLIMIWFPAERFATLSGVTMFIGTIGAVTGQGPLAAYVEAVGWRSALLWATVFAVVMAGLIWLIVRDSTGAEPRAAAGADEAPRVWQALGHILGSKQAWLIGVYGGTMSGPVLAFAGLWGVPFAMTAYGLDRPAAAAAMSAVLIGFGLGLPSAGWASDMLGRRKWPLFAGSALQLVTWLVILYGPQPPMTIVYILLFLNGLATGWVVTVFALAREWTAPQFGGSVVGFINMMGIAAAALLQPLVGYLLDLFWTGGVEKGVRVFAIETYHDAFLIFPATAAFGLVVLVFIRESYCRQQVAA